jgi:hypothetical protein
MPVGQFDRQILTQRNLAGGVDVSRATTELEASQASVSRNLVHRSGKLKTRDGLGQYERLTAGTNSDRVVGLYDVRYEDGSDFLAAHTATAFYTYDGTSVVDRTPGAGLSGANTDFMPWDGCMLNDRYFADNGRNELLEWDGSAADASQVSSHASYSGPTDLIGKYVAAFAGRVFLGFTYESSVERGTRLRWSSDAAFYLWDTSVNPGAGAVDLAETPGQIVGLHPFGHNLWVFKEDAIILGVESGDTNFPIQFPSWIYTGCLSGRSIQDTSQNALMFLGQDNVYWFTGETPQPVGTPIAEDLFDNLNYARTEQIVSWTRPDLSLYYLAIPVGEDDFATRVYVFNWRDQVWFIEQYPDNEIHSATVSRLTDETTWDEIGDSFDSVGDSWDSFGSSAAPPSVVVGCEIDDTPDYQIRRLTETSYDLYGTSPGNLIECVWASKDLQAFDDRESNLYVAHIDYTVPEDIGVTIDVSNDRGATYTSSFSRSLSAGTNKRAAFYFNSAGLYHRVRVSCRGRIELQSVSASFVRREMIR